MECRAFGVSVENRRLLVKYLGQGGRYGLHLFLLFKEGRRFLGYMASDESHVGDVMRSGSCGSRDGRKWALCII